MKLKKLNRHTLLASIFVLYFAPVISLVAYAIDKLDPTESWRVLTAGLLVTAGGSFAFALLLEHWEKLANYPLNTKKGKPSEKETKVTSLEPVIPFPSPILLEEPSQPSPIKEYTNDSVILQSRLKEYQEELAALKDEAEIKTKELHSLTEENKQLILKVHQTTQDFADYKLFSEEQLKQKNIQLANFQQAIEDQRTEVEKRQEHISQLDTKIHDLSYEIKTLLHLHETDTSATLPSFLKMDHPAKPLAMPPEEEWENEEIAFESQIHNPNEALLLLKKCINIAQKLTGANYYNNESLRYREFTTSHYTIDQRRLFDSLRSETSGLILVYSQKEHKLLFANNQAKNLLGWSPEKFVGDFPALIQDGLHEWRKAINQLGSAGEAQARMVAKTKYGQEMMLNCHLGVIPTGLFRNYVIGVLYPT